jgi:phospholipid/cholesterol/gamma-HCH transport system substrate-binding protein
VHNAGTLSSAAAQHNRQLAGVVDAGNATLEALAGQDASLREAVARLPGTLATARVTLGHATDFANALGPTLTSLMPTARRLRGSLRDTRTLFESVGLVPIKELRGLVTEAQPIARDLAPATSDLSAQTPALTTSFRVLNYVVNELGYNPPGDDEGMLFWTAWFFHNADSFLSTEDAHGAVWRGLPIVSCTSATTGITASLTQILIGALPCP